MAGLLSNVFGGPVTHYPAAGGQAEIEGVFRRTPIQASDEDGREFLIHAPTLKLTKDVAKTVTRGDVIVPHDGQSYTVLAAHPGGGPDDTAFTIFELEDQT